MLSEGHRSKFKVTWRKILLFQLRMQLIDWKSESEVGKITHAIVAEKANPNWKLQITNSQPTVHGRLKMLTKWSVRSGVRAFYEQIKFAQLSFVLRDNSMLVKGTSPLLLYWRSILVCCFFRSRIFNVESNPGSPGNWLIKRWRRWWWCTIHSLIHSFRFV